MKIVIPGGTGQLGEVLRHEFESTGDEVIVLTRTPRRDGELLWDGKTLGTWAKEFEGADVVINLAGRTVNCRYTDENLKQMMDSRVDSTRVVGEAIQMAQRPPKLWLQMSTATIYAHRYDAPNDEQTGIIGGNEPGVPDYWAFSVEIANNWEKEQTQVRTPKTRKVAMRTAMVMAPGKGGVFDVLHNMTRWGLGGAIGGGHQYVSWIHYMDFCTAVRFVIAHKEIEGAVNFTSPQPLPQKDFMRELRRAAGVTIGLPATKWMAEIGAFILRTDTELLLKSRRVVPARLMHEGFNFRFPEWPAAARSLVAALRAR
ncbi:MAG: TIGR01777 family oxidoreductase [Spirochaetes bacterium]|nr:TIGR01777 family oxidoreductase [Spirochaetota bacterium]